MNEENSVLLDTVKEKLKGLIIAKIVNNQQINAVRRAIRNIESIVAVIDKKMSQSKVADDVPPSRNDKTELSNDKAWTDRQKDSHMESERVDDSRAEISKQIATAFLIQKISISKERLEQLTDNYAQSRNSSETPYLYGVRVSQNEMDCSSSLNNSSSYGQSSSMSASSSSSSQLPQQPKSKLPSLLEGGGFAFSLFDRSSRDTSHHLDNSTNGSNYSNRTSDSFSQHNSSQSMMHSNQGNFRSSDQFNQQQNSSNPFNQSHQSSHQNNNNQQRYQQQNSNNSHQQSNSTKSHQQSFQNASNQRNNFNQRNKQMNHMPIWESDAMMSSKQGGYDKNVNSIWDTNPMQNQNRQQFNQGSGFQQNSKNQQSHYNNFQQQNQHGMNSMNTSSQQPIWDHQFSQHKQNSRNSRHH